MKKVERVTPCDPKGVSCCFDNDPMSARYMCYKCGWNPEEKKRRIENLKNGKPALAHFKELGWWR